MKFAGEQHDDARRDHATRVHVDAGRHHRDREQRGEEATGYLLVERRQPAPAHGARDQVDRHGCDSGHEHHRQVAAEHETDAGPHHAEARRHRPARTGVTGRDDPREPCRRLLAVDLGGDQVAHDVVDEGQVLVVDLAVPHLPDLDQRRLVRAGLVRHRELGEHDVGGEPPQPAGIRHVAHLGTDVGRTGAGGEQQLTDPQGQVHGPVDVVGGSLGVGHRRPSVDPGRGPSPIRST